MNVTRVYCDDAGETHFEEKDIELRDAGAIGHEVEIEVSDGSRRVLHGGEILLMEDTSGKGHRTRNVESRERRSLFITLENSPLGT